VNLCFLGTGHGVPEPHKKCSSTLFEVNGAYYLIDAGCDIAYELAEKGIPFDKVRAVFITHPHSDHINGLIPFLTITNWYHKTADFTVFVPCERLRKFYTEYFPLLEAPLRTEQRIALYGEGAVYEDENIKVSAIGTQHCPDSHAFLVETGDKRILFTGDLKDPQVDFPPVDDLDAAVVEGVHFPLMNYESVLKDKNIKVVYVQHFGNHIGRTNHAFFKPLQAALPMPVYFTTDGMLAQI